MDRNPQIAGEDDLLAVHRADEGVETEFGETSLELTGREVGQQHRGVTAHVLRQPRLVEVVAMDVADVQVVGLLDARLQLGRELVVAGEDEPRTEERRVEPRVAQDRPELGVDQDAGMSDGGGSHTFRP